MPHLVLLAALILALAPAQSATQYRARLSTVPIDLAMQSAVAGRGAVRATLAGRTLTLEGDFAGLVSPATIARVHVSPRKGMRGPAVHDVDADASTTGVIKGQVTLTPDQVEALGAGRLYVQLHSEKAPDGNLWGWLLPEAKR
jgi:hypothetical protein